MASRSATRRVSRIRTPKVGSIGTASTRRGPWRAPGSGQTGAGGRGVKTTARCTAKVSFSAESSIAAGSCSRAARRAAATRTHRRHELAGSKVLASASPAGITAA